MVAFERRDVERLEHTLMQRRDELLKQIREVTGRDEDEPFAKLTGEVADTGDEAAASAMIDVDHAAVGRDLVELRAIEATLARIERGEYGTCKDCGIRIPLERLSANPTAERCIRCQDHFEKTHGHENQPRL
ncbi:MAG: TraR/DksA family transcriptional regulator [Burkholderiales bacterium]